MMFKGTKNLAPGEFSKKLPRWVAETMLLQVKITQLIFSRLKKPFRKNDGTRV